MPPIKRPLVRVPGLPQKLVQFILNKAHESVRDKRDVIVNQTLRELYCRQEEGPLELSDRDLKLLAARYGELIREVAGKLTRELCEAIAARAQLDHRRLGELRSAFQNYISELTSADSASGLLHATMVQYYTVIAVPRSEKRLTKFLGRARFRKLLGRKAEEELDYAKLKFRANKKTGQRSEGIGTLPRKKQGLSRYFDTAKLTERQRAVASLRFEYDLSTSAIARRLGLHRKTVQEYQERAFLKIKHARATEQRKRHRAISKPGNLS